MEMESRESMVETSKKLWRMIIDLLVDFPEDFQNCINASPYFRELYQEEIVIFYFPKVFEIVANRIEAKYSYQPEESDLPVQEDLDGDNEEEILDDDVDDLEEEDQEDLDGDNEEEMVVDDGDELVEEGQEDLDGDNEEEMVGDDDLVEKDQDLIDDDGDENGDLLPDLPAPEVKNKEWKEAVLNCRLVCKHWNHAIESYYARPEISGIEEFKNDLDPRAPVNLLGSPWINGNSGYDSIGKTEKFFEHFGLHSGESEPPKNPILSRYISLHDSLQDEMDTLNALVKLVKVCGRGIWYMHLNIRPWGLVEDQYYLKIRELLSYTPNLKCLTFERVITSDQVSPDVVAAHPMPKLENILMIQVDFDSGGTLVREVLKANKHVPHLKLGSELEVDEEIGAGLTNMTRFSANPFVDDFEVKMMQKYGPTWKLAKVSTGDFKGLFPLLEKNWADSLLDLELFFFKLRNPNIMEGLKDSKLNLPNLVRLRLYVEDFILLDFIIPLANTLEYLEIETLDPRSGNERREKRDAEGKNQTIDFAGFENRMEQSNIWKIFQKLQKIKLKWTGTWTSFLVYTRQGEKLVYRVND